MYICHCELIQVHFKNGEKFNILFSVISESESVILRRFVTQSEVFQASFFSCNFDD